MLRNAARETCRAALLDTEYKTLHAKYRLQCLNCPEHEWSASGSAIIYGRTGCRKCAGIQRRLPIEKAKEIITASGFELVSSSYSDGQARYKVKCKDGHEWSTTIGHLREGKGCAHCSDKARHTLEDARVVTNERELIVHSREVRNSRTKLKWECKVCGHFWLSTLSCIMTSKRGCPEFGKDAAAAKLRTPLMVLREVARQNGGRLKTKQVSRGQEKLEWECDEGHTWFADAYHIVTRGQWCPECCGLCLRSRRAA